MKWPDFSNPQQMFVVVCFIEEEDLKTFRLDLEKLGNQRNVKLVVQPCPYEGIEFLYRIDSDLLSHRSGFDEHVFCKALMLKPTTPKATIEKITETYYAYFCAVLEQNEAQVRAHSQALQQFGAHFA